MDTNLEPQVKQAWIYTTHAEYLAKANALAAGLPRWQARSIGTSLEGREIRLLSCGAGRRRILVYGFAHPDENVGAGTVLRLLETIGAGTDPLARADASWFLIPSIDPDLAHLNDRAHEALDTSRAACPFKPCGPDWQIDWCLTRPRVETRLLTRAVEEIRPDVVVALHDSAHWTGYEPSYAILSPDPDPPAAAITTQVLFPEGVPEGHEPAQKMLLPPEGEAASLWVWARRLLPGSIVIVPEVNAVDRRKLAACREVPDIPARYGEWACEIEAALANGWDLSGHPYAEVLDHRLERLRRSLARLRGEIEERNGKPADPADFLNLHATLLTASYLVDLARSVGPRIPAQSIPPRARGEWPEEFGVERLLLPYPELVERQFRLLTQLSFTCSKS